VDVGSDGQAVNLASTTITLPPTLVSPDKVVSEGTFAGDANQTIRWHVETRFDNGIAKAITNLTFTSTPPGQSAVHQLSGRRHPEFYR